MMNDVRRAWDDAERPILATMRKVLFRVAMVTASPLFGLGILFMLLDKPLVWAAACFGAGALIPAATGLIYLFIKRKMRQLRERIERAGAVEATLRGP